MIYAYTSIIGRHTDLILCVELILRMSFDNSFKIYHERKSVTQSIYTDLWIAQSI